MEKKLQLGVIASPFLSGGNNVIFEHLVHLHTRNAFDIILIFEDEVKDEDLLWFEGIHHVKRVTLIQAKEYHFDILLATYWRTCYQLKNLSADYYLYFNQSVESRFYSEKDFNSINAAEAAYLLGLNIITEASWIKNYLRYHYDIDAELVRNGIKKQNYSPIGDSYAPRECGKMRVLIEGNVSSSFKNIPKTIEICKNSKSDEIWLLTNSPINHYEGVDRVISNIPIHETQKVYRSCDVLVKLSTVEGMFGPPLEMFHCGGTAITYNVTGHDEYMIHDFNSLIAEMHDDVKIIEYINRLKENPEELSELKKNALVTSESWHNWEQASLEFEQAILKSLQKKQTTKKALENKIKILESWYIETNILIKEKNQLKRKLGLRIHEKLRSFFK